MSVDQGIAEFWSWWASARHRVLKAIEVDHAFNEELIADISAHVDAIGDLDWELCAGTTAKHAFCLSPKGNPEARVVTELWRSRGPAPDETWEYYPARQPGQNARLVLEGVELARDDLQAAFVVDTGRERVDATYYHPKFDELPEEARMLALFLLLDGAFGEDGVERWLGTIDGADAPPDGAQPFEKLREAVAELERTATGERFAVLQGETENGEPLFVTCNTSLKRIDHLLHTTHVAIDLALLERNAQGLTTKAEAEKLNAIEDELATALGSLAVYFGRETRPGHRLLHYYVPDDSPAQGIIERWAKQHPERAPQIAWIRDPTWQFVKRYV